MAESTIPKDGNRVNFDSLDTAAVARSNPGTFLGGTTDARGDDGGALDGAAIFTVTGDVSVRLYGVCTTDLAGATATLEGGVTGATASLIAQTTATDIDNNEIWFAAAPADLGVVALASVNGPFVVANGLDIIETVATANITSGELYYICLWRPLSPDGNVQSVNR